MTSQRRISVFLYGLLMDEVRIRALGAFPANIRTASVAGYSLQLGRDAALAPRPHSRVYGLLMDLTHAEIDRLYATMGRKEYRPEPVLAEVGRGKAVPALCFNRPGPAPTQADPALAASLRDLAEWLGLPAAYIRQIH